MIGCPLMCSFCPQANLRSAYGVDEKHMSLGTFRTVLDKLPKHVRVDFSGMAEPWSNPQCTDMLMHALDSGFQVAIYTTLHGMKPREAIEVSAIIRKHADQVDVVCLHLPDANENMRGWKLSDDWEFSFKQFIAIKNAKIIREFRVMTMSGEGKVHPALNRFGLKLGRFHGHSRAGSLNADQIKGQDCEETPHLTRPVTCSITPFFDHNVLLPNGDVLLCGMDYDRKHVIGNLLRQNYYDLFRGDEINRVRRENMEPNFSANTICKSCSHAQEFRIEHDSAWKPDVEKRSFMSRFARRTA